VIILRLYVCLTTFRFVILDADFLSLYSAHLGRVAGTFWDAACAAMAERLPRLPTATLLVFLLAASTAARPMPPVLRASWERFSEERVAPLSATALVDLLVSLANVRPAQPPCLGVVMEERRSNICCASCCEEGGAWTRGLDNDTAV
jgi:hypothetical protein